MRIALVTTSWPRFAGDASGHFVATEARALAQCGEVTVIAPGEEVEAFGWPGLAARVKERPLRIASAAAWVTRARREIARGSFDRIVAHWALPCAWPIAIAGEGAIDVVSHGGDVRLLVKLPSAARATLTTRIATRAREWRFVSTSLMESLVSSLPKRAARAVERVARVEACAIDVSAPAREAIDAKRSAIGAPFAVCVARLVESKRVDAAIAWASQTKTPLVIVGDGPERAKLEAIARASEAPVRMVGRVDRSEALAWIAAAEVVVQASRAEGASTVEREADALGTRRIHLARA